MVILNIGKIKILIFCTFLIFSSLIENIFQSNIRIRSQGMIPSLPFSCLFDVWNVYSSFVVNCFYVYRKKGPNSLCCSSIHPCNPTHGQNKGDGWLYMYDKCLVIVYVEFSLSQQVVVSNYYVVRISWIRFLVIKIENNVLI